MTIIWWQSTSIDTFLYCFTAMTAHFSISLGQTLFHRYLGHRRLGGRFFCNHVQFHHAHYSGDHIVSTYHLKNEGNNTPFFLVPTTLVVGLSFFFLRLDLFMVQLAAMSLSFCGHVYLDKQYHVAGSWLGRFFWFRRKQQLHFAHHRHANCNFAVIDYFWDRLLGTYRSVDPKISVAPRLSRPSRQPLRGACGDLDRRGRRAVASIKSRRSRPPDRGRPSTAD